MRVGPIGDNALTLDGRMLELLRGRATVPSVDRRPVGAGAAPPAPALARPQPPLPLAPPSAGLSTGNRPAATGSGWPPLPPLPGLGGPLEAVPPPGGLPRAVAPVQR